MAEPELNKGLLSRLSGKMDGLEGDLGIIVGHRDELLGCGGGKLQGKRRKVYDLIEENPGINSKDLRERSKLSQRTLSYRLAELWNELLIMRSPSLLDTRQNENYTMDFCISNVPERYISFIEKLKKEMPDRLLIRAK